MKNNHRENVAAGRVEISSREIVHIQVGQCNIQWAFAEVFFRRRRAVRAIAAKANLPQLK